MTKTLGKPSDRKASKYGLGGNVAVLRHRVGS
jgi:hypothetical protein